MPQFSNEQIRKAVSETESKITFHTDFDNDFLKRVFSTSHDVYTKRLEFSGITGHKRVLDAGSGFGQWTLALSESNEHVHAIDINIVRLKVLKQLQSELGINSIFPTVGQLNELPYEKNFFDAAFCYGAVFFGDWKKNVSELLRVTKPGATLYLNANSLAWYIYNLIEGHNDSSDFSTRKMAYKTLKHTLYHQLGFKFSQMSQSEPEDQQSFIFPKSLVKHLKKCGGKVLFIGPDGRCGPETTDLPIQFFPAKKYGFTNIYEVIVKKL